jgi:hypothetical protein
VREEHLEVKAVKVLQVRETQNGVAIYLVDAPSVDWLISEQFEQQASIRHKKVNEILIYHENIADGPRRIGSCPGRWWKKTASP